MVLEYGYEVGIATRKESISIKTCKVRDRGGEGEKISHFLFTDDTLIFCKANEDQVTFLSWTLMWFEAI